MENTVTVDCGLCGRDMQVEKSIAANAVHPFACSDCLEEPPVDEPVEGDYHETREEQGYE